MLNKINTNKRFYLILLLGVFIINTALKLIFIDHPNLGGDEPFTLYYASHDLKLFWEILPSENNPPLFTLILHFWGSIFGFSETSIRMLPLIFSSITAVVLISIGKHFFTLSQGIFASALFTFSNYHIVFAHEARPYALFGLLSALSIFYFLSLIKKMDKRSFWLLSVVNLLLIYNHFFGFFILFTEFLSVIFIVKERSSISQVIKSLIVSSIGFLPYIKLLFLRFFDSSSNGTWLTTPEPSELYSLLRKFLNEPIIISSCLLLILLFFIKVFVKRIILENTHKIIILSFLIPYLTLFFISFKIPMFLDRYLVHASIPFFLIIAFAAGSFKNKIISGSISFIIILLMILTVNLKAGNEYKDGEFVSNVKKLESNNSAIIISPMAYEYTFLYHYDKKMFYSTQDIHKTFKEVNIYSLENLDHNMEKEIRKYSQVIYVARGSEQSEEEFQIIKKLKDIFIRDDIRMNEKNEMIRVFSNN